MYYVDSYLPASQSFIAQQAKALTRFTPEVLAGRLVESPSRSIGTFKLHDISGSYAMRAGELAVKLVRLPLVPAFPAVRQSSLVHAHFGKNGYVVGPLAMAAGKPLVTTFHGFDATYRGSPRAAGGFNQARFFARGRQEMAGWNSWNIAVSDFVAARLRELGFPEDRIFRHYIGVDTGLFRPRSLARLPGRVVSVARFVEYKGHRFIVDALAKVAEGGVPVELVMVGQGPLRQEIESYARKRLAQVSVLDNLSQGEIADLLATAKVYVHGSVALDSGHAEAFGIANLEAQAVGTPVVAFRSGGVAEAMIEGRTGDAVAERDVSAMAAAIAALLTDSAKWQSYSRTAADMVAARFDITAQARLLEDYYASVIEAHRARRPSQNAG
ncbi:MAG: glycosyltransferase [Devosia sp.]|nr:glycosyltransferase [Devosia sp.]